MDIIRKDKNQIFFNEYNEHIPEKEFCPECEGPQEEESSGDEAYQEKVRELVEAEQERVNLEKKQQIEKLKEEVKAKREALISKQVQLLEEAKQQIALRKLI